MTWHACVDYITHHVSIFINLFCIIIYSLCLEQKFVDHVMFSVGKFPLFLVIIMMTVIIMIIIIINNNYNTV